MKIEEIWEDESGEIHTKLEDGSVGKVLAGWWNGCANCGAYEDLINEVIVQHGDLEGCKYAMEHLGDGRLCKECYEDEA